MKTTKYLIGGALLMALSILVGCEDGGTGALPHHEFSVVDDLGRELNYRAVATLVGDLVSVRTIYSSTRVAGGNSPTSFELVFSDTAFALPLNGAGKATEISVGLAQSNLKVGTIAMDSLRRGGFTGSIRGGSNFITIESGALTYYAVDAKVTITEVFVHEGSVLGIEGYANGTFRSELPRDFQPGSPFPPGYDPMRVTLVGNNLLLHSLKFRIGRFTPPAN